MSLHMQMKIKSSFEALSREFAGKTQSNYLKDASVCNMLFKAVCLQNFHELQNLKLYTIN